MLRNDKNCMNTPPGKKTYPFPKVCLKTQDMFEDDFPFPKGGICQFPGGYPVLYLQIPQSFEATKWQIRSAHRLGNDAKRRKACLQWLARVQARIAPV